MAEFHQKYTIVQLLEDMAEGTEYASTSWPLHVTIADTFLIDLPTDVLLGQLEPMIVGQPAVQCVVSDDAYFGPSEEMQVTTLTMNPELVALHNNVVRFLEAAGATFDDPQFTHSGFRAHATVQSRTRLHKGDTIECTALSVIDMFPNEDPYKRKILKTFKLLTEL
jgi:hypothetical protein